jgi:hypothetical protein
MFVAPDQENWADPRLPRIGDPELRSRVVGYLDHGWILEPGDRTDGVWVWPQTLAERLRRSGVGPRAELLSHILAQRALIPASPSGAALAATSGSVTSASTAPDAASYHVARAAWADGPSDLVRMEPPAAVGTAVAGGSWLTPCGWRAVGAPPAGLERGAIATREVRGDEAAETADALTHQWHTDLCERGRESPPAIGPRLARIFDATLTGDRPAFSPNRVRILERARRDRIVRYLQQGRLVLGTNARWPDPLTDDPTPRVPLSFRTDGVWVWSEASAHYLTQRGVAPELEFLCYLEERAGTEPPPVSDEVGRAAAEATQRPTAPIDRPAPSYYQSAAGALFRRWRGDDRAELLADDLRWRRCDPDWSLPWTDLVEITEVHAGRELDRRWPRAAD